MYVSKGLAALEIPHKAATVELITRIMTATVLFINISVWSAVLYKQTIFQWLLPKPAPAPAPVTAGPGGSIIINQNFSGTSAALPAGPEKQ